MAAHIRTRAWVSLSPNYERATSVLRKTFCHLSRTGTDWVPRAQSTMLTRGSVANTRCLCKSTGAAAQLARRILHQGAAAAAAAGRETPNSGRDGLRGAETGRGSGAKTGKGVKKIKAVDLALKVRKEKREADVGKVKLAKSDSPVLRRVQELRQFTLQLQKVHPNVLAKALKRGILYEDQELIAINKPYGVPVHGGPGVKNNIGEVLSILAKMTGGMGAEPLHLCHRLDKETTGAMLLAKSEESADHIHHLFKTHQVVKKYWVLCVGVPVPSEGVIDIPIIEREVSSPQPHFKMSLAPVFRLSEGGESVTRVRPSRKSHQAVTHYCTLASTGTSALVELQPVTGVKHQIRVHMSLGLGCQILGDHKYAHNSKLAPQKLSEGFLRRLGLEQSKARHLPLHLHARQLIFPGGRGGHQEIIVSSPLPKFFLTSLKRLKIALPGKEEP
ncbi:mitochondrial RNA pseudouridine synthase rpusd4 [Polyodon spathula]|uniref:mitochondrial RNA pseudouridine synthase rpusd4 n=1 Tax=Polyodon spathula TaxID=7913 RepID=UPI001B7F19FF|nr:mitochondrial RNA pseudouridine synthase rpusd4 [Polyodon spathula]